MTFSSRKDQLPVLVRNLRDRGLDGLSEHRLAHFYRVFRLDDVAVVDEFLLPNPFNSGWVRSTVIEDWTKGFNRSFVTLVEPRVLLKLTCSCVPVAKFCESTGGYKRHCGHGTAAGADLTGDPVVETPVPESRGLFTGVVSSWSEIVPISVGSKRIRPLKPDSDSNSRFIEFGDISLDKIERLFSRAREMWRLPSLA